MEARAKASLLWGLVGALSFLVLAQGARIVGGLDVTLLALLGIAVAVFGVASLASYGLGRYLERKRQV